MLRVLVIAAGAASLLGACTVINEPYDGRGAYYNPPGWVDRDRDGRDDRVERRERYQGGHYDRWGNWHRHR
jgi:regulator of RNase E activity RraB